MAREPQCDVFIIGGGQTDLPLARDLAAAGKRVILAERRRLGGSCVNFGCSNQGRLCLGACRPPGAARIRIRVARSDRRGRLSCGGRTCPQYRTGPSKRSRPLLTVRDKPESGACAGMPESWGDGRGFSRPSRRCDARGGLQFTHTSWDDYRILFSRSRRWLQDHEARDALCDFHGPRTGPRWEDGAGCSAGQARKRNRAVCNERQR